MTGQKLYRRGGENSCCDLFDGNKFFKECYFFFNMLFPILREEYILMIIVHGDLLKQNVQTIMLSNTLVY